MRRAPRVRARGRGRGWRWSFAGALVALAAAAPPAAGEIRLREVGRGWGLDFRHHHGGSGARYMVETMGGGLALVDYDGDGDLDVYFVDGGALPGYTGEAPGDRLLRNDGGGRFVDVTAMAGLAPGGYGLGAAAGDVDGDGDVDLYRTAFGRNGLLVNRGDGTFGEAGAAAGVDDPLFAASAALADPDRDGDLDLFVANYVDFALDNHRPCTNRAPGGRPVEVYCNPGQYEGEPDRYYRNRGDGTFEEAAAAAGLAVAEPRAGLGVAFGDLDGDGWTDLYVANDAEPNLLFWNRGDGTFEESALLAGTAYGDTGRPEAGMGVALGDVDGDALPEIVVTNFELETNALYRNAGGRLFTDRRFAYNLAEPSLYDLAFGVALADLDLDGDLDLAVANGHILDNAGEFHERSRYAQPNRVFENDGRGRFREAAGAGMTVARVSRGLAVGDLDGDGDPDLVIVNSDDRAEAYENLAADGGGRSLALDLEARRSAPAGAGARVTIAAGGVAATREVGTAGSYLSAGPATLILGLGGAASVERLEIAWPAGRRQRFERLPGARRLRIVEPGREIQARARPSHRFPY